MVPAVKAVIDQVEAINQAEMVVTRTALVAMIALMGMVNQVEMIVIMTVIDQARNFGLETGTGGGSPRAGVRGCSTSLQLRETRVLPACGGERFDYGDSHSRRKGAPRAQGEGACRNQ